MLGSVLGPAFPPARAFFKYRCYAGAARAAIEASEMRQYIIQRLLLLVPVVLIVVIGVFLLVNALPGDVIDSRLSGSGLTRAQIQQAKVEAGLTKPPVERFGSWLGNVLRGNLGKSLYTGQSVASEIRERAPATLEVGFLALLVGMVIAIPLGTLSAIRPHTPLDYAARLTSILGLAIPDFFLAVVAILALSRWFGYFPPVGYTAFADDPQKNLNQIWLPVLVLGFSQSAGMARIMRSTMLDILRTDYIRTSWAKGLRERTIVRRHAVRNALIPVITILGLQVGGVIGGVIILETLFNIPGMGSMLVNAVFRRDLIPLQSLVLLFALVVMLVNLGVDLSYAWLDPRIRYR
jgi:peptide/nickel transport system permease protein